ncbi:hypothetical protein VP424E501_P0225 [Vibrio phage 424E50-1]|nr:hypothetical protein VP424E501_P0225 [Vibrio phage 424E50-1]
MAVHFGDTPEGEKISRELEADLQRRLALEDEKMWKGIILRVVGIMSVIPFSMLLAWIIRGGNL